MPSSGHLTWGSEPVNHSLVPFLPLRRGVLSVTSNRCSVVEKCQSNAGSTERKLGVARFILGWASPSIVQSVRRHEAFAAVAAFIVLSGAAGRGGRWLSGAWCPTLNLAPGATLTSLVARKSVSPFGKLEPPVRPYVRHETRVQWFLAAGLPSVHPYQGAARSPTAAPHGRPG